MNSSIVMALGILTSSFFGSWHCAGMCGPIASLMAQRKDLNAYHLGRFTSYIFLGVLGGSIGQFFLNNNFRTLRIYSAFTFALLLILMGLRSLYPHLFKKYLDALKMPGLIHFIKRIQKFHLNQSGFMVGALTALLPCGWLYTYVTAAIATQSPWSGALVMLLFWLGGIPALSVIPAMVRNSIQAAPIKQQKISGFVLIAAGLYSIFSFVALH